MSKDILSEFDKFLSTAGDGGHTSQEISDITGMSTVNVRRKLGELIRQGKAEMCGYKKMVCMTGHLKPSPAYRLIKPAAKKALKKKARD